MSKPFLRYGEVIELLTSHGLSKTSARTLIEDKTIKGESVRPGGRDYYSRAQIERDVLDKLKQAGEGPASADNSKVEGRK